MMNLKQKEASEVIPPCLGGQRSKWEAFAIVAPGVFMANLDTSIVNVSLPSLARTFQTPLSGSIEWVVIAYLTVIAGLLLPTGWLSDRLGRKRLWIAGLSIFTLGSLLCGVAPTLLLLIAARGLQGVGGAFLLALAPAILSDAFPPQERGRVSGLNAVTVALGASTGPILGGLLTQFLTWRWIFLVNIPLGCLAALLAWRLPAVRATPKQRASDLRGVGLLVIGLSTLVIGLSFGQSWGWLSAQVITILAISATALGGLILVERHTTAPILDGALFRQRVFLAAILSLLLFYLAVFAINVLLPFYLENLRTFPPGQVGLLLMPVPLSLALVAPWTGRLSDRFGSASLAAGGLGMVCLGLLLLCQLDAHSSLWAIEWRLVLIGVGQATFISPNNGAILKSAPRQKFGIAGGTMATSRVVGQSVSVALSGAVFAGFGGTMASHLLEKAPALTPSTLQSAQQTFLHSLHAAFLVSAVIAALGVIVALGRGKEQRNTREANEQSVDN